MSGSRRRSPQSNTPTQYLTSLGGDPSGSLYGSPVPEDYQSRGAYDGTPRSYPAKSGASRVIDLASTRPGTAITGVSEPARPASRDNASEASSMYFFKKERDGRYRLADQTERRRKEEKHGLDTLIQKAQKRVIKVNEEIGRVDSHSGGSILDMDKEVLENIFSEMDADGDGLVGLKSFSEGLRRLGLYATLPTSDIEVIFKEYDFDGTGYLNFGGFYKAYKLLCWKLRVKSILRKVFMIMDEDKDGYINLKDFAAGLRKHNLYERLNNTYIGVIFKEFDNGTGRISWPEFWARYKTLEVRLKKRGSEDRWIVGFLDALYDS